MSVEAVKAVLYNRGELEDAEFILLLAIAERADEKTREAFPGMNSLAEIIQRHPRRTRTLIGNLVALGLLTRIERFAQGRQTSNLYRVEIEAIRHWGVGCLDSRGGGCLDSRGGEAVQIAGGGGCLDSPPITTKEPPKGTTPLPPKGGDCPAVPKAAKKTAPPILIEWPPTWEADMAFQAAWSDYLLVRRQKRQPITQRGAELAAKKLLAAGIVSATNALTTSATNGWTGIFIDGYTGQFPNAKQAAKQAGADEPTPLLW